MTQTLLQADPDIHALIQEEHARQNNSLGLIASENHVSPAVLEALGSCLTDKYAEGYPGRRWYFGCEQVDQVEQIAIDRAKQIFGVAHANVQPHSGANANTAVFLACLKPGDKIMGMDLAHGGHLSHGMRINFSGKYFEVASYGVEEGSEVLDMDKIREQVLAERPKLLIAGASAYPRTIDFEAFGAIAKEAGCLLMADIAHIAGLVAAGLAPSPVGHADFITTTIHKTLRGPRGGMIMCTEEWAKKIDVAVFPGLQGGPLEHAIAAKAVCFKEALSGDFKTYQQQVIDNANTLASELTSRGWRLTSGGTDNHLMLLDLRSRMPETTGDTAANWLRDAEIVCNKNSIPFDPRPPMQTSGLRLGTPAITSRGMGTEEVKLIAESIDSILTSEGNESVIATAKGAIGALCAQFPIPTKQ
ncbi:MAG: serine hydroxymethyltransferase [Phycisphaerales bacterium]|jgi:glycine hydroxymethyltransferase|nr:serine hydroxymethyltransferase [Phycisphaerales bacterium]